MRWPGDRTRMIGTKVEKEESMNFSDPFTFENMKGPIHVDLAEAFRSTWRRIAAPGSGWSGRERVAAAEKSFRMMRA